jgi:predicted transposase YbfD/YdcC
MPDAARWKGLKSISVVESERLVNGQTSIERRYYINTLTDVACFALGNQQFSFWKFNHEEHENSKKLRVLCVLRGFFRQYFQSTRHNENCYWATRAHWGIENSLHWLLDVTFREDDSRIRTGYAPENFNAIWQIAFNLLKQHPSKLGVKAKRLKAALE